MFVDIPFPSNGRHDMINLNCAVPPISCSTWNEDIEIMNISTVLGNHHLVLFFIIQQKDGPPFKSNRANGLAGSFRSDAK